MIQLIRGFRDILPPDTGTWQSIEEEFRGLFSKFGYCEIRIPMMEKTELFARSIGEDTDIVEKEMYTFPDRKGDLLTLRPEATASIVRSYIQHKMYANDPVRKFYTIGPMFRRERPQKGRYRQFYQIDAEIFGISSPYADVELIFLLMTLFNRLNVTDTTAHINSLGCPECRPSYRRTLATFLNSKASVLCEDCSRRHTRNPLRVLDCKVPTCREAMADAPAIADFLCDACRQHFSTLQNALTRQQIPFTLDKGLVRGLDYYTRTIFEIQTSALGAQSAVVGGGRYDGLVKALGGPDMPATGFAIGLDRLAEIVGKTRDQAANTMLFLAALGEKAMQLAFECACALGSQGIHTEMDFEGRSLKSQMKRANRLGASYVLMLGEAELETGKALLRDMETKTQIAIPLSGLVANIVEKLNKKHIK